ncbi:MAG TPA: DNA recombination protein RmuC [Thermopetrobacter sp.]|nr:DNA recombination protein RmuC [Thermopetrobacter sp.]
MSLNDVIIHIGERPVSLAEGLLTLAALMLALLILAVWLSWRAARARRLERHEAAERAQALQRQLAELSGHLQQQAQAASARDTHLSRLLAERLDSVSLRIGQGLSEQGERTAQHLKSLAERLAVIDEAQKTITRLSGEVVSLQRVLADKQTRGAFGQARMQAIITDALPASAYAFQCTLSNNARPDCVIHLPEGDGKVVIDAKFPLEAFEALRRAETPAERDAALRALRTDITKHINDIASKYLIPGETHDTAIMFVPAESIYAELYENHPELIARAHRKRVILASPNVLMLMVQTIQAVIKDARMRSAAHLIQKEVGLLLQDVRRLLERAEKMQRQFATTARELDSMLTSANKIARRGEKIEQLELDEEPADARQELVTAQKPGGQ